MGLLKKEKMTTYFITGGYGFLGQYIVKAIHEHDKTADIRVLVRTQRQTFLDLESLDRITWISGELTKPETYRENLKDVDIIVHNAAMVSFSPSDREKIINANVIGTEYLVHSALNAKCKTFIFISSISAIDFRPPQITTETFLPDLVEKKKNDVYGYTKRMSEMLLYDVRKDMKTIILNPSVILGKGSDKIGSAISMIDKFPMLPMIDYMNAFVDVRDVADAVICALTKGQSGERYIVSSWNMSMVDFTKLIVKCLGKTTQVVPLSAFGLKVIDALVALLDKINLNPGIRRPSQMNIDKPCSYEKIKSEMGWEPKFTMEQSIMDTIGKNNE